MASLKETFSKIRASLTQGTLNSFLPLLPFIKIDGKPMSLRNHYPLEPFFRLQLPRRIVFKCGRQVGKCFVKSSLQSIYKDTGYPVKTTDLQIGTSLITKNDDLNIAYNPILNIFDNGVQQAIRITTRRGSVIEVTPNHKLYTVLGYKEAQNLSIGEFLMYPKKAGVFKNIFKPESRIKTTAYLIGDGSIQQTGICFTSNEPFCIREYIDCVENKCNIQSKQKTDAKTIQTHRSATVTNWMLEDGLMNTYSDTKFIPEWVFNLSKRQTALFISRLWATDGSIKIYNKFPSITYCSVSRDLIYQVQALLMKFGVTSAIRCKEAGYRDKDGNKVVCKDAYELRVEDRESWSIFLNTFKVPGKPSVNIPSKNSNSNRRIVPMDIKNIIQQLFSGILNKHGKSLRQVKLRATCKYNTTYTKLLKYIKLAEENNLQSHPAYTQLKTIYESDFYWDKIKSIEVIPDAETMDLEIKENHNYLLNGIAVHNSISLAVRGMLDSVSIPNFHTLFIQPRYDQVKRFSNNYMRPILNDSPLGQILIDPRGEQSILQRSFNNGSNMYFSYAFLDADRCRGFAVAKCCFDESVSASTAITYINPDTFEKYSLPISEIKAGMMVESFTDEGYIIYSVVSDDASYHGERDCYKITTEQGRTVEGTLDHPLWTDQGPMRIGEMVKYVYGTAKEFNDGIERRTNSDGVGNNVGGREHAILKNNREILLPNETRRSTTQIQSGKIHDIVRIRYKTSRAEEERKIQGILLGNSQTRTLSLSLQNDIQRNNGKRPSEESCNTGVVRYAGRTSSGMVDTGRRVFDIPQVHDNMLSGVLCGGEHSIDELAADNIQFDSNNTEGFKKWITFPSAECREHMSSCELDKTVCCEEYDVQVKEDNTYMSCMSKGIIPGGKTRDMLPSKIQESSKEMDRRTYGRIKGVPKDLGGGTQGSGKRVFSKTICSQPGKKERVSTNIQGEIPGTCTGCTEEIFPLGERIREGQKDLFKEILQGHEGPGKSCAYQSQKETMGGGFEERSCEVRGVQGETERVFPEIQGAVKGEESFDRIISIEYTGIKPVYDIEVVGTHNYVLANSCKSLNCQDINYEFIPIIGETMSAQTKYGFYQFSGTPKTIDNTLNVLFEQSSKAEWIIKCGCGKHNIPNLENDIMKMIGKKGCICSACGKLLDISSGNYVHANTNKINSFRGYHISQVTHPLHAGFPAKWDELLYKLDTYPESKFYNEILGEPCDEAVKPLTEGDIRKASNGLINDFSTAVKERRKYDAVVMGVDWSGYGADNLSTTAVTIVGIIPGSEVVHCIFCERFKTMPPEEEAKILVSYAHQFKITYLAHDFSGAGMIREATIIQCGYPAEQIIPFQIVHAPIAQSIINYYEPTSGGRHCYNIDKTRSLMVLFEMIKKQKVTLPDWEKNTGQTKDILRDLLNIMQETRETPRGGEFTLMIRVPERTDDFAHALNLACAAVWHVRGRYPSLVSAQSKSPTPEDMHLMDPQTANWKYE